MNVKKRRTFTCEGCSDTVTEVCGANKFLCTSCRRKRRRRSNRTWEDKNHDKRLAYKRQWHKNKYLKPCKGGCGRLSYQTPGRSGYCPDCSPKKNHRGRDWDYSTI